MFLINFFFQNSLYLIIVYYVTMLLIIQVFAYFYMCVLLEALGCLYVCVLLRHESVLFASTQRVICQHNLKMDIDMLRVCVCERERA